MTHFPRSLIEFQRRFPDERACAECLARVRWPDGFRCPPCGQGKGWELSSKAFNLGECASCRRQTSVTAGTVMHATKLPLTVWFWAAYLMATHSNGIAALAAAGTAGIGIVQVGLAARRQAAPGDGRPGTCPAGRPGGGRRDNDPLCVTRTNRPPAGTGAATRARCWWPPASRCTTVDQAECGSARSRMLRPKACTPSSEPMLKPAPPPGPTADPATPAPPALPTSRTSSARWPPTSSCRGRIASSPT